MSPLRDYLLDTYEFADSRRRDRAVDVSIRIDDRGRQDVVSCFCSMEVRVPDSSGDTLILSIQHIPLTEQSRSLIEDQGGKIREFAGMVHVLGRNSPLSAERRIWRYAMRSRGRCREAMGFGEGLPYIKGFSTAR